MIRGARSEDIINFKQHKRCLTSGISSIQTHLKFANSIFKYESEEWIKHFFTKIFEMKITNMIRKFIQLKLLRSLLIKQKAISINSGFLPVRFYGKIKTNIHRKALIIIKEGVLTFNSSPNFKEPYYGWLEMYPNSKLIVNGNFSFMTGSHVIIAENAKMTIGSGYINRFCHIKCYSEINIGDNVVISENVSMWDSDVHEVLNYNHSMTEPINIGNHVWIGTNTIILKGVNIGNNSIIGAGSVVNRDIPDNCLAAGNPAKVIKHNINWK